MKNVCLISLRTTWSTLSQREKKEKLLSSTCAHQHRAVGHMQDSSNRQESMCVRSSSYSRSIFYLILGVLVSPSFQKDLNSCSATFKRGPYERCVSMLLYIHRRGEADTKAKRSSSWGATRWVKEGGSEKWNDDEKIRDILCSLCDVWEW